MAECARNHVIRDLAIESLRKSGTLQFRAQGTSMLPTIRAGSLVRIRCTELARIAAGNVILTNTPAGLRLHRVVGIAHQTEVPSFITRGDNHTHNDPPVTVTQVLGKLDRVGPGRWRLVRLLRRMLCARGVA